MALLGVWFDGVPYTADVRSQKWCQSLCKCLLTSCDTTVFWPFYALLLSWCTMTALATTISSNLGWERVSERFCKVLACLSFEQRHSTSPCADPFKYKLSLSREIAGTYEIEVRNTPIVSQVNSHANQSVSATINEEPYLQCQYIATWLTEKRKLCVLLNLKQWVSLSLFKITLASVMLRSCVSL